MKSILVKVVKEKQFNNNNSSKVISAELLNNNNSSKFNTEELLNGFITFLDVSPRTVRAYHGAIRQLMTFFKSCNISQPLRNDIITYRRHLEERGLKPSTIHLYLVAIRRFFQWTEQTGLYPNIAANIKAPKQDTGHKKDYFAGEQIKSILNNIDRSNTEGLRNYALLALMTTGGLRTIEAVRANVEDLQVVGGVSVLYIQGKWRTDKKDFVKLTSEVESAIRTYLKARGEVQDGEPLFASQSKRNRGQRVTTRTISGICKKAMRLSGFNSKRLTAHSLRHTAVTLALMSGQSLEEVQHFARHRNISTTQIYAHNLDRMNSQCEASIARAIF